MGTIIRLRQQGRKNQHTFRVVVADSRSPRDGKYIEMLGWYNPRESVLERMLLVKPDRVQHWMSQGAALSERIEALLLKTAPALVTQNTQRVVEKREKERLKRRARQAKKA